MRITNNTLLHGQLIGLQANMAALEKANQQITTGLRFQTAAEDPTGAVDVMTADSSLRALEQYKTNVSRAASRVQAEDTALQQLSDLMTRAKQLGVSQISAGANEQTRANTGAELQQIFQHTVAIGNTTFGNEFLFGGAQSTTTPFAATGSGATIDYTSSGSTGQRSAEIGAGQTMVVGHDGQQVFVASGVLNAVRDLTRAMDPASASYGNTGITAALEALDTAFAAVQTVVGEIGARGNQLDSTVENLTAFKTSLTALKSDRQDVDLETTLTELTSRQSAYQAAMLATSKVLGPTLTDYLR